MLAASSHSPNSKVDLGGFSPQRFQRLSRGAPGLFQRREKPIRSPHESITGRYQGM
jgi:hypothetical protein